MSIVDLTTLAQMPISLLTLAGLIWLGFHLSKRIDALDARLSGCIDSLDARLSGRLDSLDARLSGRIDTLDGRIDTLDGRVGGLEAAFIDMKTNHIAHLELHDIRNEVMRTIEQYQDKSQQNYVNAKYIEYKNLARETKNYAEDTLFENAVKKYLI